MALNTKEETMISVKIDLADFEGHMNTDEFIECLKIVEQIFDYKAIPHNRRVKLMTIQPKKSMVFYGGKI